MLIGLNTVIRKWLYFVVAKLFFLVSPIIVPLYMGFKNGLRLPDKEGLGSYLCVKLFSYFIKNNCSHERDSCFKH